MSSSQTIPDKVEFLIKKRWLGLDPVVAGRGKKLT